MRVDCPDLVVPLAALRLFFFIAISLPPYKDCVWQAPRKPRAHPTSTRRWRAKAYQAENSHAGALFPAEIPISLVRAVGLSEVEK